MEVKANMMDLCTSSNKKRKHDVNGKDKENQKSLRVIATTVLTLQATEEEWSSQHGRG